MLTTVFFGTPTIAVPFLKRLAERSRVIGIVTSPDRPAGRGYALAPTEVKRAGQALGLPIQQPEKLDGFSLQQVFGGRPDLGLVVAYGHRIPPALFNEPRDGLVNVHFSNVPRYRGAGPMQWALIRGETETGVSLFRIERGLDTGPIFVQKGCSIDPEDNAVTLREKLVSLGLALMDDFLSRWEKAPWPPTPQQGEATLAPLLTKEDGRILWKDRSAREIENLIRGTCEWPGAFGVLKGQKIKILRAVAVPEEAGAVATITAVSKGQGFLVKCRSGSLRVLRVQPEGKKEMTAPDFWNGAHLQVGDHFGD